MQDRYRIDYMVLRKCNRMDGGRTSNRPFFSLAKCITVLIDPTCLPNYYDVNSWVVKGVQFVSDRPIILSEFALLSCLSSGRCCYCFYHYYNTLTNSIHHPMWQHQIVPYQPLIDSPTVIIVLQHIPSSPIPHLSYLSSLVH